MLAKAGKRGMLNALSSKFTYYRVHMIIRLLGTVVDSHPQMITLMVQGVGYAVGVVDERAYSSNKEVDLHIYYHWNQENGPTLYGFATALERTVFSNILSCSGCGPKIGLAVLAHLSANEFVRAIAQSDTRALSSVSGIGPKKAELMIMQLKDKIPKMMPAHLAPDQGSLVKIKQLSAALTALHYKPAEISSALEHLNSTGDTNIESAPFDELIRRSLAHLAKRL